MKTFQLIAFTATFGFMAMHAVAQPQKVKAGFGVAVVQTEPEFPGGTDSLKAFLHNNLKYPQQLKEGGRGGSAILIFIVDKDGKIVDPKLLNGLNKDINAEALRVVGLMPDWKPGTTAGMPVNKEYILPVYFAPAAQPLQTAIK
jgi:hypothetical protein